MVARSTPATYTHKMVLVTFRRLTVSHHRDSQTPSHKSKVIPFRPTPHITRRLDQHYLSSQTGGSSMDTQAPYSGLRLLLHLQKIQYYEGKWSMLYEHLSG